MKIKIKNAEEFREKLILKGLTAKSLAEDIGITKAYMYTLSKGHCSIGAKLSKQICEKIDAQFNDIFLITKLTKVSETKGA